MHHNQQETFPETYPPVLHILLGNIVVRTDVVDVTIEATEISATTDTESQDVDIRVTILQVLEKKQSWIDHTLPCNRLCL